MDLLQKKLEVAENKIKIKPAESAKKGKKEKIEKPKKGKKKKIDKIPEENEDLGKKKEALREVRKIEKQVNTVNSN